MGSDGFLAHYGLRWEVTDIEKIDALEGRTDPRLVAARHHSLKHRWGVTDDEERYFLLIGYQFATCGWEGTSHLMIEDAQLVMIQEEVKKRLLAAGFEQSPAIHLQFEPDR